MDKATHRGIISIFILIFFTSFLLLMSNLTPAEEKENPSLTFCQETSDCVLVQESCSTCLCDIRAINKDSYPDYQKKWVEECREEELEGCQEECTQEAAVECVLGRCSLV